VAKSKPQGFRPDLGADLGRRFAAFAATYRATTAPELLRQIVLDFMEKELESNPDRLERYTRRLRLRQRPADRSTAKRIGPAKP
jgi:hypothetical protein